MRERVSDHMRNAHVRAFVRRAVPAFLAGAAGGVVTYVSVLRAPIGQLARAAGRAPSVGGFVTVVAVSAVLAVLTGEALRHVFARAATGDDGNQHRAP